MDDLSAIRAWQTAVEQAHGIVDPHGPTRFLIAPRSRVALVANEPIATALATLLREAGATVDAHAVRDPLTPAHLAELPHPQADVAIAVFTDRTRRAHAGVQTAGFEELAGTLNAVTGDGAVRWIFAVDPSPLAATLQPTHVLLASTEAKAFLRAACAHARTQRETCEYWALFESAFDPHAPRPYDASGILTASFIDHALRIFAQRFMPWHAPADDQSNAYRRPMCDEDELFDIMNAEFDR